METREPSAEPRQGGAIALGILLILLGILAIASPLIAGLSVSLLLGLILIFSGIVQGVHAFQSRHHRRSLFLKALLSVLAILIGIVVIANPLAGAVSLALLIGVFFLAEGIFRVFLAFQIKPARRWGWMLVNGILSILLGILICYQWPFNAPWLVGLWVGIALLFTGVSMLLLGSGTLPPAIGSRD